MQRARAVLQQWLTTGKVDERLWKFCPPQDKETCQQICGSIGRAHEHVEKGLQFLSEWIDKEEMRLGWLEILLAMQGRERLLLKHAPKTFKLPELPTPYRGFERDAPLLYGRNAFPDEPPPRNWEEGAERLRESMMMIIPLRWEALLAIEVAYSRANSAMEMDCMHETTKTALDALKRVVGRQADTMRNLGFPVVLPAEPSLDALDVALSHFDWEPLLKHGVPAWDPRRTMSEKERADFAEWERQWADEVEG
jgi:hypothetical protein